MTLGCSVSLLRYLQTTLDIRQFALESRDLLLELLALISKASLVKPQLLAVILPETLRLLGGLLMASRPSLVTPSGRFEM